MAIKVLVSDEVINDHTQLEDATVFITFGRQDVFFR